MKTALIILLAIIDSNAYSQEWFSKRGQGEQLKGYVITIAGDTIRGQVQYDYPVSMQKRLTFTRTGDTDPVIYQPKDIRGYSCDDRLWESATVIFQTYTGPVEFNRFGIHYTGKGPLQLLRVFPEKDKLVKRMSSTKAETIYKKISDTQDPGSFRDLYIKKLETPAESVSSSGFRKDFISSISKKIGDDTELMNKISNKELGYKDLLKIIDEYNQWYRRKRFNLSH